MSLVVVMTTVKTMIHCFEGYGFVQFQLRQGTFLDKQISVSVKGCTIFYFDWNHSVLSVLIQSVGHSLSMTLCSFHFRKPQIAGEDGQIENPVRLNDRFFFQSTTMRNELKPLITRPRQPRLHVLCKH
jgi:hypothetical protein